MVEVPKVAPVNELGFFEMRLESIGGLGAHLAGRILAEAGVLGQGLSGAHFSSYGSEKKGSPVTSYVRLGESDRAVRTSTPVEEPHLVAVFHEALMDTAPVTAGLRTDGALLLNSATAHPEQLRQHLDFYGGTVAVVPALAIAVDEGTRVNTAMLGAITRLVPFLDPDQVRLAVRHAFETRYPRLVDANLRTFDRGYAEVVLDSVPGSGSLPAPHLAVAPSPGGRSSRTAPPQLGYANAPLGGLIINPGNTLRKDLSASRQGFLPGYDRQKCVDCGLCDLVCPDFCFVWQPVPAPAGLAVPGAELRGIDYRFCKGCLKCVEACPTGALATVRETPGYAAEHRVPHVFAPAGEEREGMWQ